MRKYVSKKQLMMSYINKPYSRNSEIGIDCIQMLIHYVSKQGVNVPLEYEGVSITDYDEFYINTPEEAVNLMIRYIDHVLKDKRVFGALQYGDIVIIKSKSNKYRYPSVGIYGGHGNILTAILDKKIRMVNAEQFRIIKKYRV